MPRNRFPVPCRLYRTAPATSSGMSAGSSPLARSSAASISKRSDARLASWSATAIPDDAGSGRLVTKIPSLEHAVGLLDQRFDTRLRSPQLLGGTPEQLDPLFE